MVYVICLSLLSLHGKNEKENLPENTEFELFKNFSTPECCKTADIGRSLTKKKNNSKIKLVYDSIQKQTESQKKIHYSPGIGFNALPALNFKFWALAFAG
jgi:hypothetical protein